MHDRRPNGCHLDERTYNQAGARKPRTRKPHWSEKLVVVAENSGNIKTGKVIGTYVPFQTCPIACPFHPSKDGGCYATEGMIKNKNVAGSLEANVERLQPTLEQICDLEVAGIDQSRGSKAIRLHIKGDAPTDWYASKLAGAIERFQGRGGGQSWAYTHAWRDVPRAAWGGISVLASVETEVDAHAALSIGYTPARVFPADVWHAQREANARHGKLASSWRIGQDGVLWIACPAQAHEYSQKTGTGTQCKVYKETLEHRSCELCMMTVTDIPASKGIGIAFATHGTKGTAKAAKAVKVVEQAEGLIPPTALNRSRRANMAGTPSVAAAEVEISQPVDLGPEIDSLFVGGREHVGGFEK
jgi:hypothetical protein